MTASVDPSSYAEEIRAWLIGRIARQRRSQDVDRQGAVLLRSRILSWWIFEGRRYASLDGSLAHAWGVVQRQARILLGTSNPRWSVADSPEGETDWVSSAFQTLTASRPSFVTRAHRPGLGAEERKVLLGWLSWVRGIWDSYVEAIGPPAGVAPELPWEAAWLDPQRLSNGLRGAEDPRELRRWAHTAKRSRWPLLRNVVAESLRCVLEEQEIDRLTLPTDPAQLFELLCIVRVLRALSRDADHVRWLDPATGNRVDLPGIECLLQMSLSRESVIHSAEFDPDLRRAIHLHGVSTPQRLDGLVKFTEPRVGFDGILIESKSGAQSFGAAVYQLKCYRSALSPTKPGRMVIWGIIENPPEGYRGVPLEELRAEARCRPDEDFWVFSTADEIGPVLEALALAPGVTGRERAA